MQSLINEYMIAEESDRKQRAQQLATAVGSNNLIQLVQLLGDQLTQSNDTVRNTATNCLADTIQFLPPLSRTQLEVLTTFFSERLEDEPTALAVLQGLQGLVGQQSFVPVQASQVLEAVAKVEIRRKPQPERFAIFKLLRQLAEYNRPEFLRIFVDLTSGEKDPQNLIASLDISRFILEKYPLTNEQKEDIFDVTFCYFPVTFNPPKDMPYKISADQLRLALRSTLSSGQIAEHVIPGLINKLTAINVSIKEDTLKTLLSVVNSLDSAGLSAYWREVFDGVKYEILHGSPENETYNESLEVLRALLRAGPEYLDAIKQEFDNLNNRKLAPEVARLIVGVSTDEQTYEQLASKALEVLVGEKDPSELNSQVPVFTILLSTPYTIPNKDTVLSIYMAALGGDQDYRVPAIEGLQLLAVNVPEFAPLIAQTFTSNIEDVQLHSAAVVGLAFIARKNSHVIISSALSSLLAELPETWGPKTEGILSTLAQISVTKELTQALTIRLLNRIDAINSPEYLLAILQTLVKAVTQLQQHELVGYDRLLFTLLELFVVNKRGLAMFKEDIIVDRASHLAEIAVRAIPENSQDDYARKIFDLFVSKGQIFTVSPTNLFSLFVGAIAGLKNPLPSLIDLSFVRLADNLTHSRSVYVRSGYLRFVALVVNKWPALMDDIPLYIQWLKKRVETGSDVANSLELLTWLAKGLLLRTEQLGFQLAEYLVALLADSAVGTSAARVFGVLVLNDRILDKTNGLIIRQLYKQRLFLQVLDQLIAGFDTPLRLNYMIALSSLLKATPINVVAEQSERIVPLLLANLELEVPIVQQAAISTILAVTPLKGTIIAPHLHTVIPRLLYLAGHQAAPVAVRTAAVEALTVFAQSLNRDITTSFVPMVLNGLVPVLGDRRRDVRKLATKARQMYYGLQLPLQG